jgi:hypothetical protein
MNNRTTKISLSSPLSSPVTNNPSSSYHPQVLQRRTWPARCLCCPAPHLRLLRTCAWRHAAKCKPASSPRPHIADRRTRYPRLRGMRRREGTVQEGQSISAVNFRGHRDAKDGNTPASAIFRPLLRPKEKPSNCESAGRDYSDCERSAANIERPGVPSVD